MYNIEKISLNNKTFMFDSWNNTLELIFEINENEKLIENKQRKTRPQA